MSSVFLVEDKVFVSYDDLLKGAGGHILCSFIYDIINGEDIRLDRPHKSSTTKSHRCKVRSKADLIDRVFSSKSRVFLNTSGTTGQKNLASHKVSDLASGAKKSSSLDVWLYTFNPFHIGGFQVLLQALTNGSSIVYAYKKNKDYILNSIKKFGVTHISATPTFYKLLHPLKETFPYVSRVTLGGEKGDDFTFDLVSKIFPNAKITNIYALTEAGSVLYSSTNIFKINKDCKIINDTLHVRDRLGQFIDTGDLVSLVDDSSFVFSGRRKNIINIAGNDVNPSEVEELIKKDEGIKDAIVHSLSNSRFGNVLVCDVVKLNKDKSENDIKQFLKKMHLEDYKIPKIINFVDNLKISENLKSIS